MPGLCKDFQENGFCDKLECEWSHDIHQFCFDCNAILPNRYEMSKHIMGQKHLAAVRTRRNFEELTCPVCDVKVPGGDKGWTQHVKGKKHREVLSTKSASDRTTYSSYGEGDDTELRPRVIIKQEEGIKYCQPCGKTMKKFQWKEHRKGKAHKQKVSLMEVAKTLKELKKEQEEAAEGDATPTPTLGFDLSQVLPPVSMWGFHDTGDFFSRLDRSLD
ncbi:hypothetical protein FRC02_004066 [Tulasnella sp. 418]|nr:hypothetical protein FRC02_004066 [Tulasnella sp. 418]